MDGEGQRNGREDDNRDDITAQLTLKTALKSGSTNSVIIPSRIRRRQKRMQAVANAVTDRADSSNGKRARVAR